MQILPQILTEDKLIKKIIWGLPFLFFLSCSKPIKCGYNAYTQEIIFSDLKKGDHIEVLSYKKLDTVTVIDSFKFEQDARLRLEKIHNFYVKEGKKEKINLKNWEQSLLFADTLYLKDRKLFPKYWGKNRVYRIMVSGINGTFIIVTDEFSNPIKTKCDCAEYRIIRL